MRRISIFFIFLNTLAFGQTTWSNKIAKIIYKNCTECHRTGGIAPFSLLSYSDAQANAFSIKYATSTKSMPPWPADPSYNHHKGERLLTAQEIADISDWVTNGAPAGDLSQAPLPPTFSTGIKMQNPDKSITIPTYSVTKNTDDYRCFVIPSGVTADKFLSQIEFEPKNLSIVHHILIYQDNAQTCLNLDNADPLPGYSGTGGGIGSSSATLIGGWVPGGNLIDIPQGMGIRLKANSYYVLQIHYAPGSMSKKDSSRCHFKYSTISTPREAYVAPILHHSSVGNGGLTNGPLFIPANTVKTFNQLYTLDNVYDASIISVAPHMHLIGKSYKVFAVTPAKDTLKLVNIPNWDFHWQGAYTFQKIVKFPKSTKVYGEATYDNTSNNVFNPNSPPKNVFLGEGTADEMMLCYFTYTAYLPGDENIILDSTILNVNGIRSSQKATSFEIYPNPVHQNLTVELDNITNASFTILDINGRLISEHNSNLNKTNIDVSGLTEGIYIIKIMQDGSESMRRFVKY